MKAVLFDLDGTLIDTNDLISDSWRHTVMTHTGRGVTDDEIRRTMGEVLRDSMLWLIPDVDPDEALETYRMYQRGILLDKVKIYDGVEEVLRTLHESGCKNAVVTSRLRTSTGKILAHYGLTDLFDVVLTASDTDTFKPDPEPLFIVLDALDVEPEDAIFVGDTVHDIEAGLAAGVFTVLVDWSRAVPPEERDKAPKPDAVIEKIEDILALRNTLKIEEVE